MLYRIEKDLLGEMNIPNEYAYGIHTMRALQNFNNSGRSVSPSLIKAIVLVKKSCAAANLELNYLNEERANAIIAACNQLISGDLGSDFPIDALQGGAGTSTNMNVNEVIANRALAILGKKFGEYSYIHPIEHINLHQSTNDVYPTAVKISAIFALRNLSKSCAEIQNSCQQCEKKFSSIITIGRTEMMDAVPLTLGAQFGAFAEAFARDRWRTFKAEERLRNINLGGTAIGTGLTAPRNYIFLVIEKLREITGLQLARAENSIDQTANADCYVEAAAIMQACAVNFQKISSDLRLLHVFGEINLPPVQTGSSIMPGKINPVILESIIQSSILTNALCTTIQQCAASGTMQINEFMPLLADSLLNGLQILNRSAQLLAKHIGGISANEALCKKRFECSNALITAFVPLLGYERATQLIKEFSASNRDDLKKFLSENLGSAVVEEILTPESLMSLGYNNK
jgi:aspartate ammonia-lyase